MAGRSNLQEAIKKAAKNWSKVLEDRAVKNAPRHIKPHIYTKVVQQSPERHEIILGVTMVDGFSTSTRQPNSLPGAVSKGSMDAAALEFGSKRHPITPRKRTFKSGKIKSKYKVKDTWMGAGMAHQRGWLLVPNMGYLPKDAGEGYKPNTTKDGNFLFVKEVDHPGSKPYNGVGYLRISISQTKGMMFETEKKSIAKAIKMEVAEKFKKSKKVLFVE